MTGFILFCCVTFVYISSVLSQAPTCSVWDQKVDYNSDNGELQANALTIDACKAACLAHYTGCQFGFDWSPSAASNRFCWVSTNIYVKQSAGITHYSCQTIKPTPAPSSTTTASSAIPPSATTRAPCPSFSVAISNNSNIQGSIKQSTYTNLNDCLTACQNTNWCTGIDWNTLVTSDQQCWFSIGPSSAIILNNYPGVNHYHLTCSTSNTPSGNVTPVSASNSQKANNLTPIAGSLLPAGCTWKLTDNTNTANGLVQPSANTLASCQSACYTSANACANGLDWNPANAAGSMCFISTTSTLNSGATGVSHYSVDCGATTQPSVTPLGATWNVTSNSNSPGGVLQNTAQSLEACKTSCIANLNSLCAYGFDWNPTGNQCWFSTTSAINVNGFPGVDHYVYVQPTSGNGTICTWVTVNNTNSPGGVVQPSATTLDACLKVCSDLGTGCAYGVDWNPTASAGTQCWLSNSNTKTSFVGVNHYDRLCVNTGGCTWSNAANTNSPGGTVQPSASSLTLCQTQCITLKDTSCKYGFDWNPSNPSGQQCYFATSTATSTYVGVTHYTLQCSTGLTTPLPNGLTGTGTGGGSNCQWTPKADTNTPGGVLQSSATTLNACQSLCLASQTTTCQYGFDWNPSSPAGQQCYFSLSKTYGTYVGVTHYDYTCLIPPTTAPTGCTWNQKPDTNTPGGVLQSNALSLSSCQALCLAAQTTICQYGFDWNPSNPAGQQCFFSTSTNYGTFVGVIHYDPACTQASPTSLNGCTWTQQANTNTPGGVQQSSATSLTACQTQCLAAQTTICQYGFDWNPTNPVGQQCFFSTSTTFGTFAGVTHYTAVCSGGATTGTPNQVTTSIPGCTFSSVSDTNSPGGTAQPYDTLDACKAACIAVAGTKCQYGFDFNPSATTGGKCWFAASSTTSSYTGVTHYNINCAQTTLCQFTEIPSSNSPGGTQMTNVTTLDQCKALCSSSVSTTCKFGFDFNPASQSCFFSTSATINVGSYPGVSHYNISCSGGTTTLAPVTGPSVQWTQLQNTFTAGGQVQSTATTLDLCKSQCYAVKDTLCKYGFDWNPSNPSGSQCWFSTSSTTYPASGITHYTYSSTPSNACSWSLTDNSYTSGGTLQAPNTLDACKTLCSSSLTTTCAFGFDWNVANSQCFFSTNSNVQPGANGIQHYTCQNISSTTIAVTTPSALPNITSISNCTWTPSANTNTIGGSPQVFPDFASCRYNCALQSNKCTNGFDFNSQAPVGQQCWFSITMTLNPGVQGITHYAC